MNWQKLYNPLVIWLLRSPMHGIADKTTMVITVTGRKSGKRYTIPVSYITSDGIVTVISRKDRTWWKNLKPDVPITIMLHGHTLQAKGEICSDTNRAANILLQIMRRAPAYQRFMHLRLNATGQPEEPEIFMRVAKEYVVIQMQTLSE